MPATSEACAQAEVRTTTTERHVLIGLALDVEAERVLEHGFISIHRDVPEADLVASLQRLASQFGVTGDVSPQVHDRRCPPQDLFGRAPDRALGVPHELVVLPRVFQESVETVGGCVAGRLVPGGREKQETRALSSKSVSLSPSNSA